MKSLILTVLLAFTGFGLLAQKQVDKIKELLKTNKVSEAKTEIDNYLANEKNQKSSEAWYVKAKVYNAIAADANLKATVPTAREVAFESLKKYIELEKTVKDSTQRQLSLLIDNRQPFLDLYAGYSKDGAAFYNANNFNDAFVNFKKTLDVFDFMVAQGWTNKVVLDTTSTLYAGIAAEKANKLDDAAIYYGKIADQKATGEGFVEIYKWLANHHKEKGDIATSQKYLNLGREVYPTEKFWTEFEVAMLREKGSAETLFAKYEELIKNDPNNYVPYFNYAVDLFQRVNNPDSTKRPANPKELTDKMVQLLNKSIELKADYPESHIVLGQIYYNKGVEIDNVNKTIRPPKGGKLKPEDLKKKEELRNAMNKEYDVALQHFAKVDQIWGPQGKLKPQEKQLLKEVYDLMITIYEQRQDKDKALAYTEKFTSVDKVH